MGQQFHVVIVRGREVEHVRTSNGNPIVFAGADQALNYANEMSFVTGHKYQPRPVPNDINWKQREKDRFTSGHYTKLPWHKELWVRENPACCDHFPHVSKNDSKLIAYTADEAKALADVKSVMKPSKYLDMYYVQTKILSEATYREWLAKYKKLYDKDNILHFAYKGEDIVKVYQTGPQSCMKNPPLRSKVHPAMCYEGPDLAIAYVKRNRVPTARCVVWPAKKIYGRLYGDTHLLAALLAEEGYQEGSLEGARLTKIKQGNRIICPYIDHIKRVKVGRKYLYISRHGRRIAAGQDGFCGQGFRCGFCEPEYCEHDSQKPGVQAVNIEAQTCCDVCHAQMRHNDLLVQCSYSGFLWRKQNAIELAGGEYVGRRYEHEGSFLCRQCKQRWSRKKLYDPYKVICRDCGVPQREMPF